MNSEFTIILEIEAKLIINTTIAFIDNDVSIATFLTLLNDVIFSIAIDVLRTGRASETVAIV